MALLDPPREAVPEAVKLCQVAGIKVIMATWDRPATANSIPKQVHIIRDRTLEYIARERGISVHDVDPAEVKAIVVPGSQIADLTEADWDSGAFWRMSKLYLHGRRLIKSSLLSKRISASVTFLLSLVTV
jgi:magnesium-transporting ATPase (P-type)